jgi:hypothetical protein
MDKHSAIYKLYPSVVTIRGDIAYDKDEQEVAYDNAVVEAEMAKYVYVTQRQQAYPSIVDQLDTLYHGGYDAWKASIQAIKDQFPKGVA